MKIEKISDTQIRCTLSRQDLADRDLKLSELAYGSDKAKDLFRELMIQASYECGFEAEDIPLMIEAIPLNSGCLVLVITKVEDPEELDTRFSNFAPSIHDEEDEEFPDTEFGSSLLAESAEEMMNLFRKMKKSGAQEKSSDTPVTSDSADSICVLYTFESLTNLMRVSRILASGTELSSSLYKNPEDVKL